MTNKEHIAKFKEEQERHKSEELARIRRRPGKNHDRGNYTDKNLDKKIWFRAKRYGYGWEPSTWQGWLVTGIFLAIIIVLAFNINWFMDQPYGMIIYFSLISLLVVVLVAIAAKTGEKAHWQWGDKKLGK